MAAPRADDKLSMKRVGMLERLLEQAIERETVESGPAR